MTINRQIYLNISAGIQIYFVLLYEKYKISKVKNYSPPKIPPVPNLKSELSPAITASLLQIQNA